MAHSRPFVAAPEHQEALGFPGRLVEDWHDRAIARMGELLDRSRGLRVFLDSCVKCGACTDKCHYFLGTGDPKNMPVARQDLLRKVYRRHFTLAGKLFPKLVGGGRPHRGGAGGLVPLLPPVLAVPALLGVLPLRHRHRGGVHGRARDPRQRRPGAEVQQRDRRQGPQDREQPRPAAAGPGRHPRRAGGGRRGRYGGRGALPPRRGRRRGPPRHPVRGLLRRAARGRPHRLRQGVPPGRDPLDAQHPGPRRRRTSGCSSAATRTCARWRYGSAKPHWSSG